MAPRGLVGTKIWKPTQDKSEAKINIALILLQNTEWYKSEVSVIENKQKKNTNSSISEGNNITGNEISYRKVITE